MRVRALMPRMRVGEVELYYEERGSGEPIVLLHGFTTTHVGNWERPGWIDLLARNGFRVVAPDSRSHGRSQRVYEPRECTTERLTADVVAILDHCGIERAHVFGFSMGAGVALDLAMRNPDRVRRVVVAGIADAALNEFHDPEQIGDILAAFEAESAHVVASPTARRIRRNAEQAGNELRALAPFLRCGGWPGGVADPRPVAAPVLLITAEADQYMVGIDEIVRFLEDLEIVRVRGRDHHTVLDDESVRGKVLAFLGDG